MTTITGIALGLLIMAFHFEYQPFVKLLAVLKLRRAVWITHQDGERRFQFLRRDHKGGMWCHSMGSVGTVYLLSGGKLEERYGQYVKAWEPYGWSE